MTIDTVALGTLEVSCHPLHQVTGSLDPISHGILLISALPTEQHFQASDTESKTMKRQRRGYSRQAKISRPRDRTDRSTEKDQKQTCRLMS